MGTCARVDAAGTWVTMTRAGTLAEFRRKRLAADKGDVQKHRLEFGLVGEPDNFAQGA